MTKVFIVGSEGTTGLRLKERMSTRPDVELVEIDEALRKDMGEIKRLLSLSDYAFLCLPDSAAKEVAALAQDIPVRVIDASTAHRTDDTWAYGFPELSDKHREKIRRAKYTASPGCHAGGAIALIYPLVSAGLLKEDAALSITSLTGYSGGGKKMIADYQNSGRGVEFESCKLYAMGQQHKHLPEIVKQCSLKSSPLFLPIVGDYYAGMLVTVPLDGSMLNCEAAPEVLREIYTQHYQGSKMVKVSRDEPGALWSGVMAGRDDMYIYVSGCEGRVLVSALFDNLGKGASGAAVQCFNIMCGLDEETGLNIG